MAVDITLIADGGRIMIQEMDTVVLTRNVPEFGLKAGDVGTVVHCYTIGNTFEVEFVTGEGLTVALLPLEACELRPLRRGEILHARALVA